MPEPALGEFEGASRYLLESICNTVQAQLETWFDLIEGEDALVTAGGTLRLHSGQALALRFTQKPLLRAAFQVGKSHQ